MPKKITISQFSEEIVKIIPHIARMSRFALDRDSDPLTEGKITLPQYLALDILSTKGSMKMKDIAGALGVSLPAATGLVSRIVSMKMAKRVYDKNDRRVIYISLTPAGKKTIGQIRLARKKIVEKVFEDLSDKEREIYLNIIRKVKKSLYEKSAKK